MDDIPLGTLGVALALLLVASGFFSIAETAMMAVNRYRLKHRAQRGERGAQARAGAARADRPPARRHPARQQPGRAGAATLTAVITKRLFGEGELALALGTRRDLLRAPRVLRDHAEGDRRRARRPHRAGRVASCWRRCCRAARPVVWFVNLFVQGLLRMLRIRPAAEAGTTLTQEELRSLVLEGQYFRGKHRAMLANLLDLEAVTVDDVMTPRNQIHALDLAAKAALLAQQLATSYHTRLPVYEDELDNIVGIVHLKQVVHLQQRRRASTPSALRPILRPAYFVPAGTPLLTQLQQFQNDRERLGLVVDEYGELQGLVTIEDIVEEIIGEFTTQAPAAGESYGARARRQRRRRRHGAAAHAQPQARHPTSRSTGRKRSTG